MGEIALVRDGAIATVVLFNPEKLNAITPDMWRTLRKTFNDLEADDKIRVVILSGDGERAFCAGADVAAFGNWRPKGDLAEPFLAPTRCAKPVIAKIKGICYGGGLMLAAACDIAICADDASFRMPAARLGLGPGFAGVARLVSRVGAQNAADIFFSARKFGAVEAVRMGLCLRSVSAAALDDEVGRYAEGIAANAPLTIRATKRAIVDSTRAFDPKDSEVLQALNDACFTSADFSEGRNAFEERRDPKFTGR